MMLRKGDRQIEQQPTPVAHPHPNCVSSCSGIGQVPGAEAFSPETDKLRSV